MKLFTTTLASLAVTSALGQYLNPVKIQQMFKENHPEDYAELKAVAQEFAAMHVPGRLGDRKLQDDDTQAMAMACFGTPTCTGCVPAVMQAIGGPGCMDALGETDKYMVPEASDGHSMGVMAIIFNANLTDTQVLNVCTAVKTSAPVVENCAVPAPFEGIIDSLEKEEGCKPLLDSLVVVQNDTASEYEYESTAEPESEGEPEGVALSEAEYDSVEAQLAPVAQIIGQSNLDILHRDLGLTLTDILAKDIGILPPSGEVAWGGILGAIEVFVTNVTGECTTDVITGHVVAGVDANVFSVLEFLATNATDYEKDLHVNDTIVATFMPGCAASVSANLVASSSVPNSLQSDFEHLSLGAITADEFTAAVGTAIVAECYNATEVGAGTWGNVILNAIGGGYGNGNDTLAAIEMQAAVTTEITAECDAAHEYEDSNYAACISSGVGAAMAVVGAQTTCASTVGDAITAASAALAADLETCIGTDSATGVAALQAFVDDVTNCVVSHTQEMADAAEAMGNALGDPNNMGTLMMTVLQIQAVELQSKMAIYTLAVLSKKPDFLTLAQTGLDKEAIFSVKHSMRDLTTACDSQEVSLGTVPQWGPTSAPVAAPTTDIVDAASTMSISMIAMAIATIFLVVF